MTILDMNSEVSHLRAEEERILASFTQRLIKCRTLDFIHRTMSDFAIHPARRALSARRSRLCQGRELRSRRRSRCSASLTESISSPNSPA
jgi:hypothetical protein